MQTSEILDHLPDPRQFVCLCRDLLLAEGALSVRGAGQGNDQGADLIADIPVQSPVHDETITFLVQGKWFRSGKSIGSRVLSDGLSALDLHGARGLLIVTTSTFSGTAISHANAVSKSSSSSRIVAMWDREEVVRRLRLHPRVTASYLYPSPTSPAKSESRSAPRQESVEEYICRAVPERYSSYSVASFPPDHLDEDLHPKLKALEERFATNPPAALVINGGVFSGKSGLAWSLINAAKGAGYSFLALDEFRFKRAFFFDEFHGTSLLPQLIRELRKAEIVYVEDIGSALKDRSPMQVQAANLLKEVIHERVSQSQPVVIVSLELPARELREYVDYLSASSFVVTMPSRSVGGVLEALKDEAHSEAAPSAYREGTYYLGRGWLLEKYEKIKGRLDSLRRTLLQPEEEHLRGEELRFQLSGDLKRSRIQVAVEELGDLNADIERYSTFVESIPFHAIAIEDGRARLLPR